MEQSYFWKTRHGFDISDRFWTIDGRMIVVVKRSSDFVVGLGYDVRDGTYAQGVYDFSNRDVAKKFAIKYVRKYKSLR